MRAGKEGDAQKLDDVRVAEGAHQLALPHELARRLWLIEGTSLQDWVDGFGGGGHRESHLVHCAIGPSANVDPSELNIRENEQPQTWMFAKECFSHCQRRSRNKCGGRSRLALCTFLQRIVASNGLCDYSAKFRNGIRSFIAHNSFSDPDDRRNTNPGPNAFRTEFYL